MKNLKLISLVMVAFSCFLVARDAQACKDIPVETSNLGHRNLYFLALCGEDPEIFKTIQNEGTGVVVPIEETLARQLAFSAGLTKSLNNTMGIVRHVYVRGGGPSKPMLVFPLQEGWSKGLVWWGSGTWDTSRVSALERSLDRTPYEFLRKASTQLLAYVAMSGDLLFNGDVEGVAYAPLNMIFLSHGGLDDFSWKLNTLDALVLHETSHYLHYYYEGFFNAMCWAGEYGKITWKNRNVGKVPLPCLFKKFNADPASYVSDYAMTRPAEDFAETAVYALKSTQALIVTSLFDGGTPIDAEFLFYAKNIYLKAKAHYMTQKTTYGFSPNPGSQQDGDADGITWVPTVGGDCDDLNPSIAMSCFDACDTQDDCPTYFHCDLQTKLCGPGCIVDANCPAIYVCLEGKCEPPPPVCGDGIIEGGEQCDPGCTYSPAFTCYKDCVLKYDGPDISKEMGPICP